jgi:peptidoglycan/xylan/chitin deacetylase (PgdA/CDA1 family)
MDFRFDRIATLYLAQPLQRIANQAERRIPILMYHSIADEDESHVHPYFRTATHPRIFSGQMDHLATAGYSTLSVRDAVRQLQTGADVGKCVVITFDDGYKNFYTNAFPALSKHGFTADMYLPTAHIGDAAIPFKGKECLTWNEVRELEKHGISFGSHTVSHPKLYGMSRTAICEELTASKQTMEQKLGHEVESFAYPYAFPESDEPFKDQMRELMIESGYGNGVCTTLGCAAPGDDIFFLKRLPVNSCDDDQLFSAKLAGAYDWLATPQRLVKLAKNSITHRSRVSEAV